MDTLSAERRSALMRRIRSKDTMPEMVVRRPLHGLGEGSCLDNRVDDDTDKQRILIGAAIKEALDAGGFGPFKERFKAARVRGV